jgi:dGTPase
VRIEITVPVGEQITRLRERAVPEPAPTWRGEAERDRDRILYSSALLRLGHVTQVTASEPGHIFHTRLTHTLKVAQVARALARRLKQQHKSGELDGTAAELVEAMDPEATEAAALAHDLGHPPFGHIAEERLNVKADAAGGFDGNAQSLRIVTRLAVQAQHPPGLNLTRETLNGVLKYPWLKVPGGPHAAKWGVYAEDQEVFDWIREDSPADEPTLVARLMDWADDLTYAVHDVDDFYRAGLVPLELLASGARREVQYFRNGLLSTKRAKDGAEADALMAALEDVLALFMLREAYSGTADQRVALRTFGSRLIGAYVDSVSLHDGRIPGKAVYEIVGDAERQVKVLKALTWVYVVRRPSLAVMQHGQRRIIDSLHEWYMAASESGGDRRILPPPYQSRLEPEAAAGERCRLVTDLVASLSEHAAVELYRRMVGAGPGSIIDAASQVT